MCIQNDDNNPVFRYKLRWQKPITTRSFVQNDHKNIYKIRTITIIHNTLSIVLGTVFILSAVTKFICLRVFGTEVLLYLEVYFGGWLNDYGIYVAGAVCMAELLSGIACLLPRFRWLGRRTNVWRVTIASRCVQ